MLSRTHEAYAGELLQVRHDWAHMRSFSDDDAYRALDTAERLMTAIGAPGATGEVAKIRLNLRRVTADKADKKSLQAAVVTADSARVCGRGARCCGPHEDVATGNFAASEFAADLYKVATGGEVDADYADPVEFFRRTYPHRGSARPHRPRGPPPRPVTPTRRR